MRTKDSGRRSTFKDRQKYLSSFIRDRKDDSLLISHLPHIRYLTGFSGSTALLLCLRNKYFFITDFRYKEQARKELRDTPGTSIRIIRNDYWRDLCDLAGKMRLKRMGYQAGHLTCLQLHHLNKEAPRTRMIPIKETCEGIVKAKAPWEIGLISKATRMSDNLFGLLRRWCRQPWSERDISARLEYEMKVLGCDGPAFPSVVASGKNSALPHAQTTSRRIRKGDFVTMDYGGRIRGYCTDMTRTLSVGQASTKQKKIYAIVLEAQERALKAVRPGLDCSYLDGIARDFIKKSGYGRYFGHALGHGVGIEVHEGPSISKNSKEVLRENMVITIEPGIYIPGWGGVRIEDIVVVTRHGHKNLVKSSKELLEIPISS